MTGAAVVLVTAIIPGLPGNPDTAHSWQSGTSLQRELVARDPFQRPEFWSVVCGPNRALATVRDTLALMPPNQRWEDWYQIYDDVIMEYWETRDDNTWWTPLCTAGDYTALR